jgi:hypothetical protein
MSTADLWPFIFEVNVVHVPTFSERTLFVTIEEDGTMHWVDHSGRFGHSGGFGAVVGTSSGEMRNFRGGKEISKKEELKEKEEFTVTVPTESYDPQPIRSIISRMGKPWFAGWPQEESTNLHELLLKIYWRHVNQFVHAPFPNP